MQSINSPQWKFLKRSAEFGRLAHAYIFSGNDRESKSAVAFRIAQLINCKQKNQLERPCHICAVCRAIERHSFSDVTCIEPDTKAESQSSRGEIKISQIRQLHAFFSLGSWVSPYKIAIIDQAHRMNPEAQSAFLKLLEEPKGNTLFLLLADHAEILFGTIRSRAQEIKFYNFKPSLRTPLQVKKNFESLRSETLSERFAYAKKLSEAPEDDIEETLEALLTAVRIRMLEEIKRNSQEIQHTARAAKAIQEISSVLETTNVNTRLALENLMLQI